MRSAMLRFGSAMGHLGPSMVASCPPNLITWSSSLPWYVFAAELVRLGFVEVELVRVRRQRGHVHRDVVVGHVSPLLPREDRALVEVVVVLRWRLRFGCFARFLLGGPNLIGHADAERGAHGFVDDLGLAPSATWT